MKVSGSVLSTMNLLERMMGREFLWFFSSMSGFDAMIGCKGSDTLSVDPSMVFLCVLRK